MYIKSLLSRRGALHDLTFLRVNLDDVLEGRVVALHIFESAESARSSSQSPRQNRKIISTFDVSDDSANRQFDP